MRKIIYFFVVFYCVSYVYSLSLEITEVYPNPEGKDKGNESEFIEIHNYGNFSIGLNSVILKNSNNRTIEISDFHDEIKAYGYLVFYPSFNLKNKNEKVMLIYGYDIIDEFYYNESLEGYSWIKINNEWYAGKKSPFKANFKNITVIEHNVNCSISDNQSIKKPEDLLSGIKKEVKKEEKLMYVSKMLNQKRIGFYFLLLALGFVIVTFIFEKWKEKR